jgi:DNA-directed RNA polymerase specialized sigma24 family protein
MTEKSEDDDELAIRMMDGDHDALRIVLERYQGPVKDILYEKYSEIVQDADIDEAIQLAAMEMFEKAADYDQEHGLGAWFYVRAESRVIDVLRRERRHRIRNPLVDPEYDLAQVCDRDGSQNAKPPSKERQQRLKDMLYVIDHKLGRIQKGILKADLAFGASANAACLADQLRTSIRSIHTSRNHAHANVRRYVAERERRAESLRGRK